MHLIELYSTSTGSKIDKPFLYSKWFPLPRKKYITIHSGSGMGSKNYDFWQDVINYILPKLQEFDYQIVQIGGKDEGEKLHGCIHLMGQTNLHQTHFIIQNSSLHLGNDSFSTHVAGMNNIPLISLYSVTKPQIAGPFWKNQDKTVLLESHRNGNKPSFSNEEFPKTVNMIKPEVVVENIFKLLEIPFDTLFETIYIGGNYKNHVLEIVPSTGALLASSYPNSILNIRMDYAFNESFLAKQLSQRKCVIVTDRVINIDLLNKYKENIQTIFYEIKSDFDINFVKKVRTLGVQHHFISSLSQVDLNNIKLDMMDYGAIIEKRIPKKEDITDFNKINENTLFKTKKILVENGNVYASKAHWKEDIRVSNMGQIGGTIIDTQDFWEDIEFFNLYNNVDLVVKK